MDKNTLVIIEDVTRALKNSGVALTGLYLFGSRSIKIHEPESDYDIAVVLKTSTTPSVKDMIRSIIYDVMLKHDIVIDSHIYSENEITEPSTPFREMIRNEGIYYAV